MRRKAGCALATLALLGLIGIQPAVAEIEPDGFASPNSLGTALPFTTLSAEGDITNTLTGPVDRDYFSFTLGLASPVTIDLLGYDTPNDTTLTLFDPFLRLYDSGLNEIGVSDDEGGGEEDDTVAPPHAARNAQLILALNPGLYYAEVANAGDDATITATQSLTRYRLQVTANPTAVIPEPGTCVLTASGLLPFVGMVLRRRRKI